MFLVLHRPTAVAPPDGTALLAEVPSEAQRTWFIYGPLLIPALICHLGRSSLSWFCGVEQSGSSLGS